MMSFTAIFKTCMVVILAGGCLVAAFYAGYILILLFVLAVIGGLASSWFKWKEERDRFNFDDW